MKKILVLITLMFALSIGSFAQTALNIQGGFSWSEGVISAGYQYKSFEVKGGMMFAKMPGSGDGVNGFVAALILGPEWDESGYYFSYSFNSVGYRSQMDYVTGMSILSIGYKLGTDIMYLKADVGYGWCGDGKGLSYGVVIGIPLFGTY